MYISYILITNFYYLILAHLRSIYTIYNVGDQLIYAIGLYTISWLNTPPNLRLYRLKYYTNLNQILALNRA